MKAPENIIAPVTPSREGETPQWHFSHGYWSYGLEPGYWVRVGDTPQPQSSPAPAPPVPQVMEMSERLKATADYYEEQADNARFVWKMRGPSDDYPEMPYRRVFVDELDALVALLREAAPLVTPSDTLDVLVTKDGVSTWHRNVPRYFPDPGCPELDQILSPPSDQPSEVQAVIAEAERLFQEVDAAEWYVLNDAGEPVVIYELVRQLLALLSREQDSEKELATRGDDSHYAARSVAVSSNQTHAGACESGDECPMCDAIAARTPHAKAACQGGNEP